MPSLLDTVTCIIPAKGTSSRLPGKNMQTCDGVPLVVRAYKLALECDCFENILVSTESEAMVNYLRRWGYTNRYLRPATMAQKYSPVEDAIAHALEYLAQTAVQTRYVCLLHPTSPCLTAWSVIEALGRMMAHHAEMIISVSDANVPCNVMGPLKSSMRGFLTDAQRVSFSQNRETMVKLNNAIIAGQWDIFEQKKNYYETDAIPYYLGKQQAIDIDDHDDLCIAEGILMRRDYVHVEKPVSNDLRPVQRADGGQAAEAAELPTDAGCRTDQ